MLLYSRKKVRYRRDGYCWKKRKDGKTTREDHMKLKVQGTEVSITLVSIHFKRELFTLLCAIEKKNILFIFKFMRLMIKKKYEQQNTQSCLLLTHILVLIIKTHIYP